MEYSTDCDTRKSMGPEITLLWQFVTPVRRSRIVLPHPFYCLQSVKSDKWCQEIVQILFWEVIFYPQLVCLKFCNELCIRVTTN